MSIDKSPFKMTISLNALNHLGINLYSNVPAVLSELVANAYDADATEVKIVVEDSSIVIKDNGHGMSLDEINARYLTVGYQRRAHQTSPSSFSRKPMGRKGIGKLAVFSIADTVELHTVKKDISTGKVESSGLLMRRAKIEELVNQEPNASPDKPTDYRPDSVDANSIVITEGTWIKLTDLRRTRTARQSISALRKRLARRFTVIGSVHNFRVFVNDEEVTLQDRDYLPLLELIWFFGAEDREIRDAAVAVKEVQQLDPIVDADQGWIVSGWIGTVAEPRHLGERSEEGNSIAIYAREKLVQENILHEFREARVFAQYLIGEIKAEFLDVDKLEDLATSDRQRLVSDDPRYTALKKHIEAAVKKIGLQWTDFRRDQGVQRALDIPPIREWYDRLSRDNKSHAKKLFGKIEALPLADGVSRGELYKASVLAFEKLALTDQLSALDAIESSSGIEAMLAIFQSIDELEAAHYYEIVKGRLKVIDAFQGLVDEDAKERALQKYLFNHLWLLDPSWERAEGTDRMEQSVTAEFEDLTQELSEEERAGRLDIRYQTVAGKHVIIELKKYTVSITVHVLAAQVEKYINALEKVLKQRFPDQARFEIEAICIVGAAPRGRNPEETLKALPARYVTYDSLILGAQNAYRDYLEKSRRVSDISDTLRAVEDFFAVDASDSDSTINSTKQS